jgi:hypothetical protein
VLAMWMGILALYYEVTLVNSQVSASSSSAQPTMPMIANARFITTLNHVRIRNTLIDQKIQNLRVRWQSVMRRDK